MNHTSPPESKSVSTYAVGEVVKRLRLERGYTQARLAEYAGLPDGNAVLRIEKGTDFDQSLARAESVARALGETLPRLLEMAKVSP